MNVNSKLFDQSIIVLEDEIMRLKGYISPEAKYRIKNIQATVALIKECEKAVIVEPENKVGNISLHPESAIALAKKIKSARNIAERVINEKANFNVAS